MYAREVCSGPGGVIVHSKGVQHTPLWRYHTCATWLTSTACVHVQQRRKRCSYKCQTLRCAVVSQSSVGDRSGSNQPIGNWLEATSLLATGVPCQVPRSLHQALARAHAGIVSRSSRRNKRRPCTLASQRSGWSSTSMYAGSIDAPHRLQPFLC